MAKLHNVLRSLVLELQSPQADMVRNLNKSSGQFNNLSGRINKSSGRFINLSILCMYVFCGVVFRVVQLFTSISVTGQLSTSNLFDVINK